MVERVDSREVARRAIELYEAKWRTELESNHTDEFAAIEPESETYFLGKSFSDAVRAARKVYPDRITYTKRIGHDVAVEIGVGERSC